MKIHRKTSLKEIKKEDDGKFTVISSSEEVSGFDVVISAIGRSPKYDGLNLEKVGVKQDKRGKIIVDEFQKTSIENIFSLGDIIGRVELTPVAIRAGRILSERLFNKEKMTNLGHKMDYNNVASVIFSHPCIAQVGMTSKEAKIKSEKEGIPLKLYKAKFTPMYYSVCKRKVKTAMMIVCLGKEEKVVGIHCIGDGVDEMIQGLIY
jgi:glutathione reductase (NADPH)